MQYRGDNFLYGGIDFSVAGEGGPDCTDFITPHQRLAETAVFGLLSLAVLAQSWRSVQLEGNNNQDSGGKDQYRAGRQCLLVLLAVTGGLELGFKLSSGQVLWLLNPCHVLTVTQLFLLASPSPSHNRRLANTVFRLHIYWLTGETEAGLSLQPQHFSAGPVLALIFLVPFPRHIAGEVLTYWVQHLLLLVVPGYLLSTGHFTVEPTSDTAWPCLALSVFSSYHWLVLQPIGMLGHTDTVRSSYIYYETLGLMTGVNLNNMLCPAASDPFNNTYYRIIAMSYFVFLLPLVGKSYSLIAKNLINTTNNLTSRSESTAVKLS